MGQSSGNQTVSRFSVDGVLDTTFAASGVFSANLGYLGGEASVSVQPDGQIIIARTVYSSYPTVANVRVARLNADGTLDTTFGDNGWATIHFGPSSQADVEYTLAIQADGQIIVAGGADEAGNYDWALARIQGGYNRAWAQHDANYNITALADNNGKVVQRFVYSAYGVQTVLTGAWVVSDASNSVYGDQGGRFDIATGLNHFDHRDYKPNTGIWMVADGGYWDGANLYQADDSDPISKTDSSGMAPVATHPSTTLPATSQPTSLTPGQKDQIFAGLDDDNYIVREQAQKDIKNGLIDGSLTLTDIQNMLNRAKDDKYPEHRSRLIGAIAEYPRTEIDRKKVKISADISAEKSKIAKLEADISGRYDDIENKQKSIFDRDKPLDDVQRQAANEEIDLYKQNIADDLNEREKIIDKLKKDQADLDKLQNKSPYSH